MYRYIYKVGDVCFSSFEEATKVIDKAFKFNKPITIERYKLFDSYDDLYEIAVIESTNPTTRYSSEFEESIANGWIYGQKGIIMKLFRYRRFVKELIHYIFEVCDNDEDDMSIEVVCRKLYKYGLIDLDRDNRLWIER